MDTNRVQLVFTLEEDCSSIKFKSFVDGEASDDQKTFVAAIYAAVMDVCQTDEVFTYYLQVADQMAEEEVRKQKRAHLKLIH